MKRIKQATNKQIPNLEFGIELIQKELDKGYSLKLDRLKTNLEINLKILKDN